METWKSVVDYEGLYEVSNLGNVRSIKFKNVRYFKLKPNRHGYIQAMLRKNGRRKNLSVHRLVCQAFKGGAPEGRNHVNHINGVKHDNRESNLEWTSCIENIRHAFDIGLTPSRVGELHPKAKLTTEDVVQIKYLLSYTSMTQSQIGSKFGVSREVVKDIKTGRSWTHV